MFQKLDDRLGLHERLYLESFFCDHMSWLWRAIGFRGAGAIAFSAVCVWPGQWPHRTPDKAAASPFLALRPALAQTVTISLAEVER